MMKWALIGLAVVVGSIAVVTIIGLVLPREHVASRTLHVKRPPADVWALITDVGGFTSWRTDVKSVERLPDRDGRAVWVEQAGGMAILLETIEAQPPQRLVLRIADPKLPFGGTWTYVIDASPHGSALTITENGHVSNPIFRFMSRAVFGHHATIDGYLKNVAEKFNEEPALSGA
jgi:uncharacterized protein YndB with AHSA1/START domain